MIMPNYLFIQFPSHHRCLSRGARMGVLGESDWGNWSPWLSWNCESSSLLSWRAPHSPESSVSRGTFCEKPESGLEHVLCPVPGHAPRGGSRAGWQRGTFPQLDSKICFATVQNLLVPWLLWLHGRLLGVVEGSWVVKLQGGDMRNEQSCRNPGGAHSR